ncbi:hypothetical protein KHS38_14290 [Mucilaginibacter sp. Bleaf8]|uniref:hypothetical protein n=1 Tax=Mucilaginibacter sp. Bleaf8 TaxID=2834430 RepID=UPI001BCEE948|nr:hypothetical protein [Mucilaginibacter sp. Bleaf8]MBS7565579.1 hypothetical protein [Mucilaginibacter sp. Bleaf8]
MIAALDHLGVPPEMQAYFNLNELVFHYGTDTEEFGNGFHKVPTTGNLWLAGPDVASEVVITNSAMEAIAFLTLQRPRYPKLDHVAFIAIGNQLQPGQVDWISRHFPKRKFTLVFGNDLVGNMTDIKLATGLKGMRFRLLHVRHQTMIMNIEKLEIFEDSKITLSVFERAFGLRTGIRTRKPILHSSYLNQLQHDNNR